MKIAILGAGHGGVAMACDLTLAGNDIYFAADITHQGNIPKIIENKNNVVLSGYTVAKGKIDKMAVYLPNITTNIEEAVTQSEVIMVVAPAFAQMTYINVLVESLKPGQIVVFNPGKFGALLLRNEMLKAKKDIDGVIIGECESLIYATKMQENGECLIKGVKKSVSFSALPASKTSLALDKLRCLYPQFVPVDSVINTSVLDITGTIHAVSTLLNTSHIEKTGSYSTEHYDITPSIGRVMDAMDSERMAVSIKLNVSCHSLPETLQKWYTLSEVQSSYEAIKNNGVYKNQFAPSSLRHRYVTEEVPYLLTPLSELGEVLGLKMPVTNAIITIASQANDEFYQITGRTLDKLGLGKLSTEEIKRIIF